MPDEIIKVLDHLVGFQTTPEQSNIALIDWLANRLQDNGAAVEKCPGSDPRYANLLARFGPEEPGGIVLSGHTDVVSVKDQNWDSDPFALSLRDTKLFGRGAADMKGFLALLVANAAHVGALPLRRPIYFAFTYGEETGCIGAPALVEHLVATQPKPTLAVVGEPTLMEVVTHHKAMALFRTVIIGKEAHSSRPDLGASATLAAAKLVTFLEQYFMDLRDRFDDDPLFDPPYSTFNIGRLSGGIATSFIANRCEIEWEFRTLPDIPLDRILAEIETHVTETILPSLRRGFADAEMSLNCWTTVPALNDAADSKAAAALWFLAGSYPPRAVPFGTEAGIFHAAGIPAVLCGPGSITEAHRANEFIEVAQLKKGDAFIKRVGEWAALAAPPLRAS